MLGAGRDLRDSLVKMKKLGQNFWAGCLVSSGFKYHSLIQMIAMIDKIILGREKRSGGVGGEEVRKSCL